MPILLHRPLVRTALAIVRVTSHGSVSPNAHSRVAPDSSPAAPALAHVALALPAATSASATSWSSALPSWRIALGVSLSWPSRAALEVPESRSACSSSLQGARVDRRLVAELARQLVEVEVVQPGAVVGLRELLGELVEVGEVLEDAGAVAEAEPLLAVDPLRAAPVLAGAQRLQVGVELRRAAA